MHALLCVQCFPPLVKQAGGVAKDYLALCRALIDGLGWRVTLLTPVDLSAAKEPDIDRWLASGGLRYVPARAVLASTPKDGIATFLDLFSVWNTLRMLGCLCCGDVDVCVLDDLLFRGVALLLCRALGVPSLATTHTDVPGHEGYERLFLIRLTWRFHLLAAKLATTHATVSRVYAELLKKRYGVAVQAVWPPALWSPEFARPPEAFAEAAKRERARWTAFLGFEPRAFLLYAGRWSPEKRIHLLVDAVPEGCALVIVGDSDAEYADEVEACRRRDVLPLRRMLGASELRVAYAACDLFVSASAFETLGNAVLEALSAGVPVAVQPAQGHLEFVEDGVNSYLVDFDDPAAAKERLSEIVAAGTGDISAGLGQVAARMRAFDFPAAVQQELLAGALQAAEAWRRRGCLERLFRALLLLLWLPLWALLVCFTRPVYLASREPRFRFLAAGRARETGDTGDASI